jgi:S-(hydroxymethyl)glutathione dehydrogenase/alcohol dehydrogenase
VVAVSKDIPLDKAALLGCAVLTGVGSVVRAAQVEVGSTVAVIGLGGIGASIVQGARIAGASRIIAIDLHAAPLELARRLGATDTVDASATDPVEMVRQLTGGGVDHAFEAVGLSSTIGQAISMLRPGRTASMVGVPPVSAAVPIPAGEMVLTGRSLRGVLTDIPMLVDLYLSGRLELDALIGRRIGLDGINDAYAEMSRGGVARPVLIIDN